MGGAADRASLALGNALVGNPAEALALEICLVGPTLRADQDVGCVVCGAPFGLTSGLRQLGVGTTFTLRADEVLRIGGTPRGARAYLCVPGGFQASEILGSQSSFQPLKAGAMLACESSSLPARFVVPELAWNQRPHELRAVRGPQADWFREAEFYGQPFAVLPASNRMGLRLEGKLLEHPPEELVSEPVCPGTVQVTRDGRCIVLGMDGQTIGGYPKIAQVASVDIDKLGQLRPGDSVSFVQVSLEEAENLYRQKQAELAAWALRMRTAEVFR